MKKYTAIFKIQGNLGITNNEIDASKSTHLKKEAVEALKEHAEFIELAEAGTNEAASKALHENDSTYLSIVLPSHPDNIKGSDGDVKEAAIIILESYNTDLKSIDIQGSTQHVIFEYTGTVHYSIQEKKEANHYEAYTFVAKGHYGIPSLHKTYKNELVRLCLEALSDPETVLYERSQHTTDFDLDLPEEIYVGDFDHLIVQLNVPRGEVAYENDTAKDVSAEMQPEHFDINVFNAEGIFMPEKIVYDDGDGIRKLIVSLYYQSTL